MGRALEAAVRRLHKPTPTEGAALVLASQGTREQVENGLISFYGETLPSTYPPGLWDLLKEKAPDRFHAIQTAEGRLNEAARAESWGEALEALEDIRSAWRNALTWYQADQREKGKL